MRSRRGEVQFVAVRVGRSNDPREVLSLALELKTNRATALGFVVLWEEFLLEVGDSLTGRIKGYTAAHIAAKLGWEGPPRRLLDALKNAGVLKTQRNVFFHPYWLQSITGQYARERAELRERWREEKKRQREPDQDPDVRTDSSGHGPDVRGVSVRKSDIDQLRESGAPAPQPPPQAGGEKGSARWEVVQALHKRPRNSRLCIRILDAMTEADWDQCRWVLEQHAKGGLSHSLKKRALKLDSHKFLATEAYLEFLPERRKKLRDENQAAQKGNVSPDVDDKVANSIAFLLSALADAELPEAKKEKLRAQWRHLNPNTPPPWENGGGALEEGKRAHA